MVLGRASEVPDALPFDPVPAADRARIRIHRRPQPGNYVFDSLGRAALYVHEHQHRDVQKKMARRIDPARIYASVPSDSSGDAVRAVRDYFLCHLSGLRLTAERDGNLLCHRVAVVSLLPLQVCTAW